MTIYHPVTEFLFELFPSAKGKGTEALVKEEVQGQDEPLVDQLDRIQADPLDEHSTDPERARAMATFQAAATEQGLNMAVVMFMVDALQHFKNLPLPKVKEVALEIAMLGTQGIAPDKQGFKLHHAPGKTFSGQHLLAWYYVSWKLAIPEMVEDLQLPYAKEYGMAVQLNAGSK